MSQQPPEAAVQLVHLAANEDWAKWNRPVLDKLAAQIGLQGADLIERKEDLVAAIRARAEEHARATVPEPPQLVAKVYRVIGPHLVHGAKPGKTFVAVLPPDQEAALIEGSHIKIEKENG